MATTYSVKLGEKAQVFHDQSTGITICKGEVAVLRVNQFRTKRIQNALNGGHLVLVSNDTTKVDTYTKDDIEALDKKLHAQYEKKGMTIEKISKGYTLEEAKLLANLNGVEVEESDTTESIFKAILED